MLGLGGGMVAGGALEGTCTCLGQHISEHLEVPSFSSDLTSCRLSRTESCLHVCLPCSKASGHADGMCPVVA